MNLATTKEARFENKTFIKETTVIQDKTRHTRRDKTNAY